jgi:hypothetical protein
VFPLRETLAESEGRTLLRPLFLDPLISVSPFIFNPTQIVLSPVHPVFDATPEVLP